MTFSSMAFNITDITTHTLMTLHNDIHNDTQQKNTQQNDSQQNESQQNDTQQNDTQHDII
jgi:hypothetical protein